MGSRRYTCKEDSFSKIEREEQAYWLGFLAADGCITKGGRISLQLAIRDIYHIERFKTFLNATNITEIETGKWPNARVRIRSRKIITDLANYGIVPRKSLTLNKLPDIPDHLIRHYIRGYIDGDGYWGSDNHTYPSLRLNICGTKAFLLEIRDFLKKKIDISEGRFWTQNKIYNLAFGGNAQTSRIASFLYKDSCIYLLRKFQKVDLTLKERGHVEWLANPGEKKPYNRLGRKNPNAKTYLLTSPEGNETVIKGELKRFCRSKGISYSMVAKVSRGELEEWKGWKCSLKT